MAEIWDIYDKIRKKTGRFHKRGVPLADGDYHLVVHIWVRNRSGKFLLTRRSVDKEPFPGLWECTGGSVLAGETSEEAALRETWEETGIDHHTSVRSCVLSYTRWDWHGDVWLLKQNFRFLWSACKNMKRQTLCGPIDRKCLPCCMTDVCADMIILKS